MERKMIITKDGSASIAIPEMNVTYHSIHGAIQESLHVFIEAGFSYLINELTGKPINIFEMGFGTGLNALLTLIEADTKNQPVHYTSVELYPLRDNEISLLNYCEQLKQAAYQPSFEKLHSCDWEKDIAMSPFFTFHKSRTDLVNFSTHQPFNLAYYDAFAPVAQPELWTKSIFEKLFNMMSPGGILVTYCSKGDVQRAMKAAGFGIEKIPGPPGKREILRAEKRKSIVGSR
ncbi:MAG TPA: tRNA (5-methylaminomethyl-2-thiouridine)(34)-methyltransferase MnmD [Chitinophagaceae bacterium]|nr:tRNA (5-methylaminomethyl-2-thiouridine)(34)-methyltransferase MnmD [Chitinophagaceae bacterium]